MSTADANTAPGAVSPLRSVHSTNLPGILSQLGICLFVSTYQAGRLVIVRPEPEGGLNTHFFGFSRPMGLAVDINRLLVGTQSTIDEFRNVPALCQRLTPPDRHDAAYVWRNTHVTGAIDIHEMATGADGRWYFVNTAFSCLCVMDHEHSFVPVWRPSFVSSYAPEDRCHLNGLGMVDGQPRWLTALGQTDRPQGWRENKKDGGILLDLSSNEIIARGLSMPHSPRWYRKQLWLLESGRGALIRIDPASGQKTTVAQLPGFTRGLSFAGPLAFIGLSQLRESNAFTDIPITDELNQRACGVWVVHIDSGETVALLRFEESVQEIFAVEVAPV
ncbi:MAG: TIGR03032 family protein, partial [Candidatus Competibacteraceae bacterium]|nr:TIGR03032 family protein [Candidatus Competibacteraceae bacterium]